MADRCFRGGATRGGSREKKRDLSSQQRLEVVLEENHVAPVVAFQAWVKIGSADEPPQLAGIAHVSNTCCSRDKRGGVGQIAREVEGSGGEINAWTSHDETVYTSCWPVVLRCRLDILADTLQNAASTRRV